ncbi:MAG: hypothetical protein ACRC5T_10725 [Cetobacterium sp.]
MKPETEKALEIFLACMSAFAVVFLLFAIIDAYFVGVLDLVPMYFILLAVNAAFVLKNIYVVNKLNQQIKGTK